MTLKELEIAIDQAESDMRSNISMYDSYQKIGFLSQAAKLKDRMDEQHGRIVKMKELYKKTAGIRC